jgi:uncharacterized protein YbjQ (UPF0145 family)
MTKTLDDVFSDEEVAAIEDTRETKREYEERQRDFLESVASESETELLKTQTELVEGHVVGLEAKLNGELIDRLGRVQQRLEAAESDRHLSDVSEAADEASQILADAIVDAEFDKELFYNVYEMEGLTELGTLLSRVFDALQKERERLSGDAEGFRKRS